MKKIRWGELLLPAAAIGYVAYSIGDQYSRGYAASTVNYGLLLAAPVLACAVHNAVKALRAAPEEQQADACGNGTATHAAVFREWLRRHRNPLAFFFALSVLLLLLEWVGYALSFSCFLIVLMRFFGVRSWPKILGVTAGTMLVVYGIFVLWLRLPLPKGALGFF